ncbi:MAG: glycoside hydrolase family 2 protein [Flavobacteriales bacterium]|nr:glycoside hydrolase family 2 protein [Flavobacteriales bacterium]
MRLTFAAGALLAVTFVHAQVVRIPLHEGWRFQEVGTQHWYAAEVPGVLHKDLLRHGLIADPYGDADPDSARWVEQQDWIYACPLEADDALLSHEHIDLVLHGLDVYASVYLNNVPLGSSDNAFRTWEFDVRDELRPGANELRVVFRSTVQEGAVRMKEHAVRLPADNDAGSPKVSPYVRKAAFQFGWDFSPRVVGCGITGPVELRCWDRARIVDIDVRSAPDQVNARQSATVHLEGLMNDDLSLVLTSGDERDTVPITFRGAEAWITTDLPSRPIEHWWPNGSGVQPLFDVNIELLLVERVIDTAKKRIGLRTIELDQGLDSIGRAFTFVVNGKPIFMKGCNLVPPDAIDPNASDSAWVALVSAMRRAHMNMVRVWAGGIYPPDAFYDACDTAGILVWQDLMFANPVPADTAFLRTVEEEVRQQVVRLRHHPCLALWCGNNELEVAWKNWGWNSTYGCMGEIPYVAQQQHHFFHLFLPDLIARYSDIAYTPTSALSNWGSSSGLRQGDLHYWGVWHADSTFASFAGNTGRFVSEYGFQSYPDSTLLAGYILSEELRLGSLALMGRQFSYRTDRPIREAIQRELGFEPTSLADLLLGSQLVQALAYREAIRAHRSAQPRCMGTLFWQLNDVWPGPSWSVMDPGPGESCAPRGPGCVCTGFGRCPGNERANAGGSVDRRPAGPLRVEVSWWLADGTFSSGTDTIVVLEQRVHWSVTDPLFPAGMVIVKVLRMDGTLIARNARWIGTPSALGFDCHGVKVRVLERSPSGTVLEFSSPRPKTFVWYSSAKTNFPNGFPLEPDRLERVFCQDRPWATASSVWAWP